MRLQSFRQTSLALCLSFLFATASFAQETMADLVTKLENAMRDELAHKKPRRDKPPEGEWPNQRSDRLLMQLRLIMAQRDADGRTASLDQILPAFSSKEVRVASEKLRAALRAEREATEKAAGEETREAIARAATAVHEANTAADLDSTIRDLTVATERRELFSREISVLQERLRNTRQFVIHWQDSLAHSAAGRLQPAVESLQAAIQLAGVDIVPRSEILERIDQLRQQKMAPSYEARLREIIANTKTLEDLPASIRVLADLRDQRLGPANENRNPITTLHAELRQLDDRYSAYRTGMRVLIPAQSSGSVRVYDPELRKLLLPLEEQLMRLLVPRFLRLEETPPADERLDQYVERKLQSALDRCDARLIVRIAEFRALTKGTEIKPQFGYGLEALLAAQNQNDAGQFTPAVIFYQRALRAGGDMIPAQAIGARLEAIKTAHPAEYDLGMKTFLASPDQGAPYTSLISRPQALRIPAVDAKPGSTRSP